MAGKGKPFDLGPVSNPQSQHPAHMYSPEQAITKGVAAGAEGYRVGLFGASQSNTGVHGRSESGHAGYFDGKVHVKGDISAEGDIRLVNADCAEDFDASHEEGVEPGTVMVLAHDGKVQMSSQAYDRKVAGVVSGAGGYKPGIILDNQNGRPGRFPIALFGKVCCKVDAQYGVIEPGDLLTTSPTLGHAMKASNTRRAFGAVIGKALGRWHEGQGLVPMLVVLQ